MTRLFCLTFVVALAGHLPIHAQEKKDPPKHFTNSLGMKFVWIPPGSFMMGSPKEEKGRFDYESPQHKVTLTKGFYMGVHPVTQEQWQEVMGNNPSRFKYEKNLPVEEVSWDDCQEFIKNLREKDKKLYRLPTEAEREYSARAGTKTAYYFGDDSSMLGQYAWFLDNSEKKTHPVGQKKPNQWGLYDMHGNVWQWCQDWYGEYPQKDVVDPQGPDKGKLRVQRGGSWFTSPAGCRSAYRFINEPGSRNLGPGGGLGESTGATKGAEAAGHFGCRVCFSVE